LSFSIGVVDRALRRSQRSALPLAARDQADQRGQEREDDEEDDPDRSPADSEWSRNRSDRM
jgi:hypothetical protein